MTTAECLLNKNRNPHMTREEIEAELDRQLGIKKVLWLPKVREVLIACRALPSQHAKLHVLSFSGPQGLCITEEC